VNSTPQELAWAAGLFEGEGTFVVFKNGGPAAYRYPQAKVSMTDEDVVRRFGDVLGFGTVNGPYDSYGARGKRRKPIWTWHGNGLEKTQALVAAFWPWFGERRRGRAAEVLHLASLRYATPSEENTSG
jgi:hypothetical protein